MLKIFSKMGIATVDGYRGAQIHEAIGLGPEVVDLCLRGTTSTVGGVGFAALGADVLERHAAGFAEDEPSLDEPGFIRFRKRGGEYHANNPSVIDALHASIGLKVDNPDADDDGDDDGDGDGDDAGGAARRRRPRRVAAASARAARHRQVRRRSRRAARGPGEGHLPRAGDARRQRPAAAARPAATGPPGRRAAPRTCSTGPSIEGRADLYGRFRDLVADAARRPSCTTCSRSCPPARPSRSTRSSRSRRSPAASRPARCRTARCRPRRTRRSRSR